MRTQKSQYERSIAVRLEANVPDISDVRVDSLSIETFVQQDTLLIEIDEEIASILECTIQPRNQPKVSALLLSLVQSLNLGTLQQIKDQLQLGRSAVLEYVHRCKPMWDYGAGKQLIPGVTLLQLAFILLSGKTEEEVAEAYRRANLSRGIKYDERVPVAQEIRRKYMLKVVG